MKLTTPMYERQKKLSILGILFVINNRRFYLTSKSYILYINIYKMLLQLLLAIIFVVAVSVTYKYYLKPKNEIKRYADTLRSLGYKVYVYPFSFMGLSFAEAEAEGVRLHKDAQYLQKTVFLDIDVAICNCMEKPLIFFTDPDLMKQFLGGNMPYKYPKLETMISGLKAVLGEGLIFSEGESWKKKRKLLSKVFNFDLFKENIPKIIQVCNKCFDKYESTYMVSQNTLKVNSIKFSAGISNGVMMTCFFGNDCVNDTIGDGHNYPEFIHQTTSEAQDLTLDPLIAFLGKFAWKFGVTAKIRYLNHRISMMREKAAKILKDRTDQVLKAPRKQKCSDVIEALVYQKLDNKEEFSYSDNEFVDEFQTILIAGSDTTTTYFTMIMYALGSHPEIHKRMRAEISAIIKSDEDITFENLKKLPYIDWFQYEITRLYGPANGMLFREAEEDNYVKDIPITKGTLVSTQPVGNHYNPKYFKDPYVLRPERWESECDGIHPFAFMGFSYGLRSCIGKHLAILATKIAVIKLIMRYETIEVPQKLTMNLKFMYEPEKFDVTLTKKAAK